MVSTGASRQLRFGHWANRMTVTDTNVQAVNDIDPSASQSTRRHSRLPSVLNKISLLLIWAGLIMLFGTLRPHTFLTLATLRTLSGDIAITAVMAIAILLPLAANTFDLSIGGTMGLAVIVVTEFTVKAQFPLALAVLLTLVIGVAVGVANAVIVSRFRVNSFITTLGTASMLVATQQWISGNVPITFGLPKVLTDLGTATLFTIPLVFYCMVVIAVVVWYVLDFRQFGRFLYATGSNADAARLAGVRTGRIVSSSLVLSALIATIAGLLFVVRIGGASEDAGTSYLLPAFAAAFLGATQFKEGNVNVPGTLLAVVTLATGVKGFQLMGAAFWVQQMFDGAALILGVALAVRSGRQRVLG